MREHLHAYEPATDRVFFAGMDASFLTGGAGFVSAPPAPPNANGLVVGASDGSHIGVIGLVLIAAVLLIVLDRVGFRFAVTAGKR